MKRLALSVLTAITLMLGIAAPAHACGYWDCTEYDGGWYCVWYEG